ncbi:cysteine desulfurase family protein [Marinobacter nauticus]|uniref:cysteine desulfurase family protein n=1 Tax=Marinobacter nauticus TaxID=2743 RepID=UPI001CFD7859|nr:cysteine desulfurase family protein [Marinobacter nauticus]
MRVSDSIYLDYQASTPADPRVVEAMLPYFTDSFGNPHSSNHILGWKSADSIESARYEVASLVGALPEEIVFTSGATEANNHAIFGVLAGNQTDRKTILISAIEHKCVKEAAYFFARQFGHRIMEVPVLESGLVDRAAFLSLLTDDVVLVSVMAVNNEIGTIQDVAWLAEHAKRVGAIFHCDAAQAPEAIDLDVVELGIDLLSLSAHKIYGPKGVGALYIESSLQNDFLPLVHGGGQQSGLRSGTLPTPLCVGFGVAASIIRKEGIQNRERLQELSFGLLENLRRANVIFSINGDAINRHPGNLNLEFPGIDAESLINMLQPLICASTGSACNSGIIQSSYVLRSIGLSEERASASIRFSVGRFSDEEQVVEAANKIAIAISSIST